MCECFLMFGPLAQQFKVGDGDFALFVPPLSNQPIRVHSWYGVYGYELEKQKAKEEILGQMCWQKCVEMNQNEVI